MKIISPLQDQQQKKNALFQALLSFARAKTAQVGQAWQGFANPTSVKVMFSTPTPTPTPAQQAHTQAQYQRAIEEGFKNWGSPPAATLSAIYSQAPAYAPIFRKYPFLLPAQSIAETSGGKPYDPVAKTGVTFANNVQNWGIRPQQRGPYSPSGFEQNIRDAMTGIGGRTIQQGFTPTQVATSNYYAPFRQSQNLRDFATTYAPPEENDTEKYIRDIQSIMDVFSEKLKAQEQLGSL